MEFPVYYVVGIKKDEDGKLAERKIEQRYDEENANICSGWMRNKLGFNPVFVYGGVPLKWVGDQGEGDSIYEIYDPEG